MFNQNEELTERQLYLDIPSSDYNCPLKRGETLDPCIRGAKKINENETIRVLMRDILLRKVRI